MSGYEGHKKLFRVTVLDTKNPTGPRVYYVLAGNAPMAVTMVHKLNPGMDINTEFVGATADDWDRDIFLAERGR